MILLMHTVEPPGHDGLTQERRNSIANVMVYYNI